MHLFANAHTADPRESAIGPADGVRAANEEARRRMEATPGDPLFVADWRRAVFLHYEVDAGALQEAVPFALDLWEGDRAFVSLVAFDLVGMRLRRGGRATAWVTAPIATHSFLNVRTYVRHGGERGIFFLREWLSNRLATLLGSWSFGLPYRHGEISYEHRPEAGGLRGRVQGSGRALCYRAKPRVAPDPLMPVAEGSRDDFLLERYTAFTCVGANRPRRHFRVWHEPWRQAPVDLEVRDDALLRGIGRWATDARYAGANYSPGVPEVWMGWPRRLE